jgi:hypothetical protein
MRHLTLAYEISVPFGTKDIGKVKVGQSPKTRSLGQNFGMKRKVSS